MKAMRPNVLNRLPPRPVYQDTGRSRWIGCWCEGVDAWFVDGIEVTQAEALNAWIQRAVELEKRLAVAEGNRLVHLSAKLNRLGHS